MTREGVVVAEPGYYQDGGIYLRPVDQIVVPEVPATVTDADLREAKRILEHLLVDFRFRDVGSKVNLLAMVLTSPLRELLPLEDPMVPLFAARAPQERSGKGSVIRVGLATTGARATAVSATAYNGDDVELEKKLVAALLQKNRAYIFMDNVRTMVSSAVVEQMLTSAVYDGRRLGHSDIRSLSTLVMWCMTLQATGSLTRDLAGRTVPIEIVKPSVKAWTHRNLWRAIDDHRGALLWAVFVAARRWLDDGCPKGSAELPSFYGWCDTIGGILEVTLGYEGLLSNHGAFTTMQDEVGLTMTGLLEKWLEANGEEALPAREVPVEIDDPALHAALEMRGNPTPRQVQMKLSSTLQAMDGTLVADTHRWRSLGRRPYRQEGKTHLFRCEKST
jgi:hypothetical protein